MSNGHTYKLEQMLAQSLSQLKFKVGLNPIVLFLFILNEIKPCILLRGLRLGSTTYQIPIPLARRKQFGRSLKLLTQVVRNSNFQGSLSQKLEHELYLIIQGKSVLLKNNQGLYQMASNTRALAHYRWE